jgi:DNA repair exonuclease SbcCD ATPase subunit
MNRKVEIGQMSKVEVEWRVRPVDYSVEKADEIRSKMAVKYGIPKKNIHINANFIKKNNNGETEIATSEIFQNIQDPKFQQELFKQYIKDNEITDCDFDALIDIDNLLNSLIDYSVYDNLRRYKVEWVKWSNFLSYGQDNYINFNDLNGLVLLKSEPANQGGKTNFACDLIEFLLFGSVDSGKANVLKKVFNNHLPEATEVKVEGGIEIDGEHYVIKRTLTRPQLKKRTSKSVVTQKVEYYRIVNGEEIILDDVENLEGESNTKTNQIIKEVIGNKKDFNLVVLANSDNLKELVSMKDSERGRLLSRWIGLLPLEEKDNLAREKWNKEILPTLLSKVFNKTVLTQDVVNKQTEIKSLVDILKTTTLKLNETENSLVQLNKEKEALLNSKRPVDNELLKLDVATLEKNMAQSIEEGKHNNALQEQIKKEIEVLGEVEFSVNEYNQLEQLKDKLIAEIATIKVEIRSLKAENDKLKNAEFCPTCGQKLLNVDNTQLINENLLKIQAFIKDGIEKDKQQQECLKKLNTIKELKERADKKNKLIIKQASIDVVLANLRAVYSETKLKYNKLTECKDSIEFNNKIECQINVINEKIKVEDNIKRQLIGEIEGYKKQIELLNEQISNYEIIINKLNVEEKFVNTWKYYLAMVGKNGICKMVLRQTLPIINAELSYLLEDVCDFNISVEIDDKNDINFYIIADGIKSDLSSGSGFEQTVAALALRAVLGNISTMSRPSFMLLDEVLGGVAKDNYENIKKLYDRMLKEYSFIFQVTHLDDIADWHDTTVVVKKEDRISTISVLK